MQFLAVTFNWLVLSPHVRAVRKSYQLCLNLCHKLILSSPSPLLPTALATPSCVPGALLPSPSLQPSLNTKASLALLKNRADCVTPLHKMDQTLPCSCRVTPVPLFRSRKTNMPCPQLCSFSHLGCDMFLFTPSSSASLTSCSSSSILHKCHRTFARHFLCLQQSSPRCQLGSLSHFIQISAQRSLDQKCLS